MELRYYQKQSIESFLDYTVNNWFKHPIIVLPTGSGKSIVQAEIVKKILEYNNTRVLLLTHQQQLIKQNYDKFMMIMKGEFIDAGIYSAGLKSRDTSNRVLFAGIQSVYKKAWELGWFDLILIDECHLLPHRNEGMYRTFLSEQMKINPKIVIGGLSATPYRLKDGLLTEGDGALFDDICYEATIKELIDPTHYLNSDKQQYLCNLISKNAKNKADLTNVHIRGGEYIPKEMENAFIESDLVCRAVKEIIQKTHDRNKVLIFTAGISHCEDVFSKFKNFGFNNVGTIHSKQGDAINQNNIEKFKNNEIKFFLNVNVLTTGFDQQDIDCIVLLRSTLSPGLYYQMVGRGLRIHPSKKDCLILDMGRNIERHGPIDKIEIRKTKKGKSEIQTSPQKECPECQSLMHPTIMQCPDCGYEFPARDKHEDRASDKSILSEWKKPHEVEIIKTLYSRHSKKGKPDSLRVDYYFSQFGHYSEWVCVEHFGYPKQKAIQWLSNVTDEKIENVSDALSKCDNFKKPQKIIVDENSEYPKIVGYIF